MTVAPEEVGLTHHARAFPNRPALIMGDAQRSYAELEGRVNRLARALRRAGVGVGGTVGAALHNGFEWYELLNAVGKLGAQLVPIGYRLKGPEIAYMLADSGASVLLAAPDLAPEVDRALGELGWSAEALWVVGPRSPWRGRAYEDVLDGESADQPDGAFVGGGFNTMIYTSGTTGRPKGIERAVDPTNAHRTLLGVAGIWGLTPDDVHLVAGPL